MELRPELKSEAYKAQVDEIGVNLALGRRLPTVLLGGTYELLSDQASLPTDKTNWSVSVAVNFPFSYSFWPQLQEKRAEQRQGELRRASLQDQVRLEVTTAYRDLLFWQEELPRRQRAWQQIRETFARSAGSREHVRALAARRAVLETELSYLEAVRNQLLARAQLERSVGREME